MRITVQSIRRVLAIEHVSVAGGFQAIHYAALQAASEKKLTDVLQWLVMNGADLSARTSSGLTAAELAGASAAVIYTSLKGLCCRRNGAL